MKTGSAPGSSAVKAGQGCKQAQCYAMKTQGRKAVCQAEDAVAPIATIITTPNAGHMAPLARAPLPTPARLLLSCP